MIALKVCGITRLADAEACLELGVDALGFIFYPPSPRYVSPQVVRGIVDRLKRPLSSPSQHKTLFSVSHRPALCGVFVNEELERVEATVAYCGLDFIQLHGDEPPDYVRALPAERVIKSFPLRAEGDLERIKNYRVRALLVDTYDPHLLGGTGKVANWELARQLKRYGPLILAGGITVDNVDVALQVVSPDALDVNSGVESAPGIKEKRKIASLIRTIRRASPPFEDRGA